jgi:hypothetical protein
VKLAEFESLLFVDVEERAAGEPTPAEDKPRYYGRPWSQLRDSMLAGGAKTVSELPEPAVAAFYRSTKSGAEPCSARSGICSAAPRQAEPPPTTAISPTCSPRVLMIGRRAS